MNREITTEESLLKNPTQAFLGSVFIMWLVYRLMTYIQLKLGALYNDYSIDTSAYNFLLQILLVGLFIYFLWIKRNRDPYILVAGIVGFIFYKLLFLLLPFLYFFI